MLQQKQCWLLQKRLLNFDDDDENKVKKEKFIGHYFTSFQCFPLLYIYLYIAAE